MTAVRLELQTIVGEVTSWRAVRDGWGFGSLRPTDRTATTDVAFTGSVLARVGDTVELVGVWTDHATYGRQFKVRSCTVARPDSADGIVAWLTSTLPSIGPTRARALVDRFGSELWAVIETRPGDLTEVDGITTARVEDIVRAYHAARADRDHMILLRGWGLTDSQIARCKDVWGDLGAVVDHVHANPYDLAEHVTGFGFLRADKVARKAGVAVDAPARIVAGVVHVLESAVAAGDCFLWGAELQRRAVKLLEVTSAVVAEGIRTACTNWRVVGVRARYYVPRIDAAEASCASNLGGLIARVGSADVIDLAERRRTKGQSS